MKVLAIIPARGGSKGVPRKNIRLINGIPLIAYSIKTALAVKHLFHRIIVSTDDEEISSIAQSYGADVPFLRPDSLATDKSPMIPVLQHAVNYIEMNDSIHLDWVFLMQPTNPFRATDDIIHALDLANLSDCDSVISVKQVFSVHPILMKRIENNQLLPFCIEEKEGTRRQDYTPPAYMRNGSIYLTKRDVLINQGSIWGNSIQPYIMPEERSVSIDSEIDFKLAELLLNRRP